eukprot:TRINITY_DN14986_c0_g2_i2.p1 TRINITY_DN14986_c0_g2~~TRINITY_DN14986_c0_g2_i2.p1  ORF type:complete len:603 (-),score=200.68 TRINITY_DN14986_c0_g2_i2:1275-2837(-)
MAAGEEIWVLDKFSKEYWFGISASSGLQGSFPVEYVYESTQTPAEPNPLALAAQGVRLKKTGKDQAAAAFVPSSGPKKTIPKKEAPAAAAAPLFVVEPRTGPAKVIPLDKMKQRNTMPAPDFPPANAVVVDEFNKTAPANKKKEAALAPESAAPKKIAPPSSNSGKPKAVTAPREEPETTKVAPKTPTAKTVERKEEAFSANAVTAKNASNEEDVKGLQEKLKQKDAQIQYLEQQLSEKDQTMLEMAKNQEKMTVGLGETIMELEKKAGKFDEMMKKREAEFEQAMKKKETEYEQKMQDMKAELAQQKIKVNELKAELEVAQEQIASAAKANGGPKGEMMLTLNGVTMVFNVSQVMGNGSPMMKPNAAVKVEAVSEKKEKTPMKKSLDRIQEQKHDAAASGTEAMDSTETEADSSAVSRRKASYADKAKTADKPVETKPSAQSKPVEESKQPTTTKSLKPVGASKIPAAQPQPAAAAVTQPSQTLNCTTCTGDECPNGFTANPFKPQICKACGHNKSAHK